MNCLCYLFQYFSLREILLSSRNKVFRADANYIKEIYFKGAEAACVEIANETKNSFILKDMSMLSEIFSPYKNVLVALLRK